MFSTSRFRGVKNIQGKGAKPDIFERRGGRLYGKYVPKRVAKLPLSRQKKAYIKSVFDKHNRPGSPGFDRAEFLASLEQMAKDPLDPITRKDVEKIKKYF